MTPDELEQGAGSKRRIITSPPPASGEAVGPSSAGDDHATADDRPI